MDVSPLYSSLEGVDLLHRQVWLHGEIDNQSSGKVMRALLLLAQISYDPIELNICSEGGDVEEAFGVVDVIRSLPVAVTTVAWGRCMSAAPMILAAGEEGHREAGRHTQFMLHHMSVTSVYESHQGLAGLADATKLAQSHYCDLLAETTQKGKSHWSRQMRAGRDVFFSAEQALEWGMIDAIR